MKFDVRYFCKEDGVTLVSVREIGWRAEEWVIELLFRSFALREPRLGTRLAFCHSSEQSFAECTTNGSSPNSNVRTSTNPTINFYICNVSMIHHKNAAHTSISFCMISFNIIFPSAFVIHISSSLQIFQTKVLNVFSLSCMLHALPTSYSLIRSPWVRLYRDSCSNSKVLYYRRANRQL